MTQLLELPLTRFTGGLNLRRQFELEQDESPSMVNIDVDSRGGFQTRRGWTRWNAADIVVDPETWSPATTYSHMHSDGEVYTYVANGDDKIYVAAEDGVFADLAVTAPSASFQEWGDDLYLALGSASQGYKRSGTGVPAALTDAHGNYNDDYTTPVNGRMPKADIVAAHASYLWVARTDEGGTKHPNRLRWSHPNKPEDWHTDDLLDITKGGSEITALVPFRDHLLVFKTNSLYAIYGYELNSWEVVTVSTSLGAPGPQAIGVSEGAIYFYSASGESGVYGYAGENPVNLSEKVEPMLRQVERPDEVTVGWASRRLWVTVPWNPDDLGAATDYSSFVFDPTIGNGAWMRYKSALGSLVGVVERSDVEARRALGVIDGDSGTSCLVRLNDSERAEDTIADTSTPTPFYAEYRTRWLHAGQTERRKSWRRPRYINGRIIDDTAVDLNVYWDYDENRVRRFFRGELTPGQASRTWSATGSPPGFNWTLLGTESAGGADWGAEADGTKITRNIAGLGVNRAIQLRFSTPSEASLINGAPWSFSAIILKYVWRRFTT